MLILNSIILNLYYLNQQTKNYIYLFGNNLNKKLHFTYQFTYYLHHTLIKARVSILLHFLFIVQFCLGFKKQARVFAFLSETTYR